MKKLARLTKEELKREYNDLLKNIANIYLDMMYKSHRANFMEESNVYRRAWEEVATMCHSNLKPLHGKEKKAEIIERVQLAREILKQAQEIEKRANREDWELWQKRVLERKKELQSQ